MFYSLSFNKTLHTCLPQKPIKTKNYRELEYQKRNVEVEVRKLEIKNEELKRENNKLKTKLKIVVQSIKQFFHKILNIGTDKYKYSVVREIK